MTRKIYCFLLFCCFFSANSFAQLAIIPQPDSLKMEEGFFNLHKDVVIQFTKTELAFDANWLKEQIQFYSNLSLTINEKAKPENFSIELILLPVGKPDAYLLNIQKNQISIASKSKQGIFYGLQTLLQIINASKNNQLPCLKISDAPSFAWRGMHLDVCRHFFTKEEVKKYIDYLAMYKMNVFHWHLTDDQGWRLAVEKFPKLTEIGGWRKGTMVGPYSNNQFDTIHYGGFYSKNDIKEVVQYAAERHITIVPEIEMPGHAVAALAAYPQYSCKGKTIEVEKKWGVFDDVFCAGNDSTFLFLQQVLDEVITLFPGEYIHVGGDECPKTRWKTCAKCQKRMAEEKLKDEHELQSYFIQRIEKYVNSKGKKIIGWDEILEGGLAPNAAVMSWRGNEGGIAAAKQKHKAVMTPGKPCYFDHYQHADKQNEPLAFGGLNTLNDVYNFQPIPEGLNPEESQYILGAQGNLWSEYITSFAQAEYMALPRMAAMSEVLWVKNKAKNYDLFIERLKVQVKMLDKKSVNYCKHHLSEK